MAIIIFENFDYCCNISFFTFSPLWNKYHDSFNTGLTYKPEVFVLSKNVWRLRGPGVVKIDILFFPYSLINYLVSDSKCVLCFQRIAMLLAPRNLKCFWSHWWKFWKLQFHLEYFPRTTWYLTFGILNNYVYVFKKQTAQISLQKTPKDVSLIREIPILKVTAMRFSLPIKYFLESCFLDICCWEGISC